MRYIAKNGSWVMFGQVMNGLLSLGLLVAFANLLPKEVYGTYKYILSLAGILNIFTLTGMNSALSRTIARGGEGILRPAILYQLKWNSLMSVALFILAGYYHINGDEIFALSFLILALFIPSTLAFNTYGAYLEGKKEFARANILSAISTLTYVVGMLSTLIVTDDTVWLVAVYALTAFIPSVFFYFYTLYTFKPPLTGDTEGTFAYGWKLTLIRLLGPIALQIDKIILAHFWGPAQLATYAFASAIPMRTNPAIKKIIDIGFPKFASKGIEDNNKNFYLRIFQGIFIGLLATLGYIATAPYVFKYFLPQYLDSLYYSQILALCFIFASPIRYIALLFESQKMTRQTLINSLFSNILAIILFLGFGIYGGILGLTIATVLHSFIGLLFSIVSWIISNKSYIQNQK